MMTVNEALSQVSKDLTAGNIAPKTFDMNTCREERKCGTVSCIGGWAITYMYPNFEGDNTVAIKCMAQLINQNPKLSQLFYPKVPDWQNITTDHAAKAIDQYLLSGQVDWKKVLGVRK